MRIPLLSLVLLLGCADKSSAPKPPDPGPPGPAVDDALTDGVKVEPAACPYAVATPWRSTAPWFDDGQAPLGKPRALHLSWSGDPATTMTIVWTSDLPSRGTRVEFGVAGAYDRQARGHTFAVPVDLAGEDKPVYRVHEVHLCGLEPGTAYSYRLPGTGLGGRFATAPLGNRPVRFAVTGDSRDDPAKWSEVLRAIAKSGAELLVYTGDAVVLGVIQEYWEDFFAAGKEVLPSLPLMFALGNHEANARLYFAQFAMPGNEQWFAFDYGDIHFVALNDSPSPDLVQSIANEQAHFLDDELRRTSKRWRMVFHHRAIYSASDHGSQVDLQAAWLPIYDRHLPDVVWNGHDHVYERSKPMRYGLPVQPGKGTTYIINGGGGAPLYTAGRGAHTAFSKASNGFSLVEITGPKATVTAYEVSGGPPSPIDQVVLTK